MSDSCEVFVTGAAGVLGGQIVRALSQRQVKVVGSGRTASPGVDTVWDLLESPRPNPDTRPRVVVHAAARTSGFNPVSEDPELMVVNVGGTMRVAEWALENNVEKLVLVSGALVYGGWQTAPRAETDPVAAAGAGAYGASKFESERVAASSLSDSRMQLSILRLSSLYGSGYESGLPQRLIKEGLSTGKIVLTPPTDTAFDLLHVSDAASAIVGAIGHESGGLWNVGSGAPISLLTLAEVCGEFCGARVIVEPGEAEVGPGVMNWVDDSKARRELGHQNSVEYKTGIELITDSLSSQ